MLEQQEKKGYKTWKSSNILTVQSTYYIKPTTAFQWYLTTARA